MCKKFEKTLKKQIQGVEVSVRVRKIYKTNKNEEMNETRREIKS